VLYRPVFKGSGFRGIESVVQAFNVPTLFDDFISISRHVSSIAEVAHETKPLNITVISKHPSNPAVV
jgi:hypothetical protein